MLVVALFGPKGAQPYGRVIVLHLTVLFGGWIVMLLGSPLFALVVLVALKTAADWRAHRAERQKFAITSTTATNRPVLDNTANR